MTILAQLERRINALEKIVLGDYDNTSKVPSIFKKTIIAVSEITNEKINDIKSDSRKRTLVESRSMIVAHLRENTRMSLGDIGGLLGGRNHTTILHAYSLHNDLIETNKAYRFNWELFKDKINDNEK